MKKFLLSGCFIFLITPGFCQSFMHGAGLSFLFVGAGEKDFYSSEGITYSPRFNFLETKSLSLSIGIPISIGISGGSKSTTSGAYSSTTNTMALMFDAPLIFNLNLGGGSTKENKNRVGFFIGAGYGFHSGKFHDRTYFQNLFTTFDKPADSYVINGPVQNMGMRFRVGRKYRNIELKFSVMEGANEFKPIIFGFAPIFNF